MAKKIKGIIKSFKFISRIFVEKEKEMVIGNPTDVKHVAHIGTDGVSGNAPSWMAEFKNPPNFSAATIANPGDSFQGDDQPKPIAMANDNTPDQQNAPKKQRRRKKTSSSTSSTKSVPKSKSKEAWPDQELTPNL